ncbi:hypothetical protein WJX82_004672 [Trebouxia sp. C0006]
MVDVVSFRAASELQPGLHEQMEAQQEALWESEFQAQEWQQQLLLQRLSAGGKGKASGDVRPLSQGVGGKPAQVSPSPRSSGPSLSRPQSLLTTRSHLKASSGGPVLLNNVPSPHGHHSSSRDFFSQPSPGAILTNGAPAGLQKTILELMRRQSDTVKWEQKSSRACEHRGGVASHRLSDAVLL